MSGLRHSLSAMFADTRPLQVSAFRRLWNANIVTMIGAQLTVVAVPAQIFALAWRRGGDGLGRLPLHDVAGGLHRGGRGWSTDR